MLMGTLIMQVYGYYRKFRVDPLAIRILVYGVFCLDLAQTIMLTFHGWWALVASWGRPDLLEHSPWTAAMVPFMCGLISAIVQIFYARRIWALSSNNFIRGVSVFIVLTALAQGLSAMSGAIVAMTYKHGYSQPTIKEMHTTFEIWLAGSLATDAMIAACMAYTLSQAKARTSWSNSQTLLTNLINRAVQTGAVTALCASVEFAVFVQFPEYTYHYAAGYTLGKLYSNSLMLNINMRRQLQEADPSRPISLDARSGTTVYVEQHTVRSHDTAFSPHTVDDFSTWTGAKDAK
ncbi:hypothetical protein B0H17DRAFT_113220 [Mycena rosella]|uniref:DUF6534 domain-containing protein n=1 Tax=Mycena rosella TaxID=1033263 RepID=A0AAD7GAY8_MYCRO|nr:hypothetical protein B0H17DRAFT_113220 [Mycena rosella]